MINLKFEPNDYIFNKATASRVLGIADDLIKHVKEWVNCVFVIVKGKRPRFYKKFEYFCNFADWRREQSKDLSAKFLHKEVFNNSVKFVTYSVTNPIKKSSYICTAKDNAIACTCKDYKNQQKFLDKPGVCKHGYAVLSQLKVVRLSEYIEKKVFQNFSSILAKEEAKELVVARTDAYSFRVQKGIYFNYCEAQPQTIKCECSEYRSQIGKNLCQHGYAVLNYLGFTGNQALADYVRSYEWTIDDYKQKEYEAAETNKALQELEERERDAVNCLFEAPSWQL
jgi:hypothetical protein